MLSRNIENHKNRNLFQLEHHIPHQYFLSICQKSNLIQHIYNLSRKLWILRGNKRYIERLALIQTDLLHSCFVNSTWFVRHKLIPTISWFPLNDEDFNNLLKYKQAKLSYHLFHCFYRLFHFPVRNTHVVAAPTTSVGFVGGGDDGTGTNAVGLYYKINLLM